ncbi:MAG: hypothetical protein P1Q69_13410 [Candidatus Thorarchaeota archaeon]|nr:hypothetical protein [Candidatus Thorarchaeota archaeon]
MSTKYAFPKEAIDEFELKKNISFDLLPNQMKSIDEIGATKLTIDQLIKTANILSQEQGFKNYVIEKSKEFRPFSMSLFVFNDAVWRLMEKKEESHDTMLPMATIPWFHWEQGAVSSGNPHGAKRDDLLSSDIHLDPGKSLTVFGTGGDFCGILEGQVASRKRGPRPLLAPVLPGPNNLVPNYEIADIGVNLTLGNIKKTLYPEPSMKMDYTFSEHPKIYYEHGISLSAPGPKFKLKVGRKKPAGLYGDVILLLGKRWHADSDLTEVVEYHIWLSAFHSMLN